MFPTIILQCSSNIIQDSFSHNFSLRFVVYSWIDVFELRTQNFTWMLNHLMLALLCCISPSSVEQGASLVSFEYLTVHTLVTKRVTKKYKCELHKVLVIISTINSRLRYNLLFHSDFFSVHSFSRILSFIISGRNGEILLELYKIYKQVKKKVKYYKHPILEQEERLGHQVRWTQFFHTDLSQLTFGKDSLRIHSPNHYEFRPIMLRILKWSTRVSIIKFYSPLLAYSTSPPSFWSKNCSDQ